MGAGLCVVVVRHRDSARESVAAVRLGGRAGVLHGGVGVRNQSRPDMGACGVAWQCAIAGARTFCRGAIHCARSPNGAGSGARRTRGPHEPNLTTCGRCVAGLAGGRDQSRPYTGGAAFRSDASLMAPAPVVGAQFIAPAALWGLGSVRCSYSRPGQRPGTRGGGAAGWKRA